MLVAVPGILSAQAPQDSVHLRGTVLEEDTEVPIPYTALTILDHRGREIGRATANERGRFSTVIRDEVGVTIVARRLGYQENRTPFLWFDGFNAFDLEVRLHADAVLLAPLEVVARRRALRPTLAGFRHRVERGFGWYFDREEIQRLRPGRVTDLLQRVPGVRLASSSNGLHRIVEMGRGTGARCTTQVFIDGFHLNTSTGAGEGVAIDGYVTPDALEGVEVYRGLSSVPAEFLNEDAECGVVVLWTRRGGTS